MCGISGATCGMAEAELSTELLQAMNNRLAHRGPDAVGVWRSADGRTLLAHRRLSILDLSPAGHQPMAAADGQLQIVFNGEIYNYQELRSELIALGHAFRTSGDTEVILQAYRAWGADCVGRLQGMFSFCLYDGQQRQLLLARDRAGEKPLFYYHRGQKFVFASELKALLLDPSIPRKLYPAAFEFYLAYGYVPGELCLLQGIKKLPPAHAMVYDLARSTTRIWRYWQLPQPASDDVRDEHELVAELESLLEDSVRRQLVADVPVGVMLSGGVDSSLVTAMAARVSSLPVRTFTVSFPGFGAYDESPHARLVARHFGTEHIEIVAEAASADLLPRLAAQYDEPIADSSMVPTFLVSQAIRQHATVALGGDGGDELFGGYLHHRWLQQFEQRRAWVPGVVRAPLRQLARRYWPVGLRGRNYVQALLSDVPHAIAQFNVLFDRDARRQLLLPSLRSSQSHQPTPEEFKAGLCSAALSSLEQSTRVDFATYLPDDILVKVDRASMLTSLEMRAPWLDHRLIEFAFGRVPDRLKASASERKILPRRLARKLLPKELDINRKQGFSLPLDDWLRGPWREPLEAVLRDSDGGVFQPAYVRELIARQQRGYDNAQRLFALMIFELWRKQYRIEI